MSKYPGRARRRRARIIRSFRRSHGNSGRLRAAGRMLRRFRRRRR
ncbi:hypothetical protein [Dipodfec virus UOA04_Rod_1094]|nr:hypothetical protein [Dipodfec virus UOA04_Rod_1094]